MAGTKIGGQKAAITNKLRHGKEFYIKIGKKGGATSKGGGFAKYPALARECGKIGGAISSRAKDRL